MKPYKIPMALACLITLVFGSCQSPEYGEPSEQDGGLINFTVRIPGESNEYSATVKGPYADGETLYIKVPTSEEEPLDVTNLVPYASLQNNCYATPAVPGVIDFSKPYEITVVNGLGRSQTNYVEIVPTLPKVRIQQMWFKDATEMGINTVNIPGITAVGQHLLVHDNNDIKVYNRESGAFIKEIPAPTTFTSQVQADDAGHFVVTRYNVYSAGFMVYFYEDINSSPELILNYTAALGCPVNLGQRVSVIGNLKSGKAYIYATTASMEYYYWEFNDGVPVSEIPVSVRYSNAGGDWTYALVKRRTLDADSDHFISFCIYDANDSAEQLKGSRFEMFEPNMDILQMDRANFYYKILGYDVFTVGGDEFLAMTTQTFWAWDATYFKIFEITDRDDWSLVPGDEGYSDFMLYQSDYYGGTNYNRSGDVAAVVDGNEVWIYAASAAGDASAAGILAFKMTYNPQ